MSYRRHSSMLASAIVAAIIGTTVPTAVAVPSTEAVPSPRSADEAYTVIETDLADFRARFNSDRDKVRAIFLVSPVCGICLRGVSELQETMLDTIDGRELVVYVVWSSQLGAQEHHVEPAMRLIDDDRAVHFWDPDQLLGAAYQPVFDLSVPIWDYWLLYEREAEWVADQPPAPDWYEYQGPSMGRSEELQLDTERFTEKAREILATE